eukprot:TRINITY_DN15873_c0_g1_i1.p1 TRINITY_DN15873_c0_g1~~TRINITY_DN15873_c0_g1_i1.p1  ORF type:complete len:349 (+),score=161.36 TRINITY_DN15873_c0_g1_i1:91-1137(+)
MTTILSKFRKKNKEKKQRDEKSERKRIFNLNDSRIEDHYELSEFLGKGTFAVVKAGVNKSTGQQVAVKIIDKNNIDVKIESLKTEVKILMNVKHENIVNLLDVFEDDSKVYLIMELMLGGELFDRICNDYPNGYSEKQASELIRQMIVAVQYFHGKGIIHRDLKPENLLFATKEDSSLIKISDFGLAKIWSGDTLVKTACGSPNYVAPEVLLNDMRGYTFAVDMWSLGVILYVLLCGFCPFFDENTPALFRAITQGNYSFPSPYWDEISDDAKDLIRKMLVVNPQKRIKPEDALEHPWIKSNTYTKVIKGGDGCITENMRKFKENRSAASFTRGDDEDDDEDDDQDDE